LSSSAIYVFLPAGIGHKVGDYEEQAKYQRVENPEGNLHFVGER